ncbi:hypothetical protein EPO04_00355 [Patescibacteria group bacterium]|nr:MAG: hypothetical protein EPO04_00355 [Patescibacteria group bacterium]
MLTYLKFKWQRVARRWWRNGLKSITTGRAYLRYRVWGRWQQLAMIRRFVVVWWAIVLVCGVGLLWQTRHVVAESAVLKPLAGGRYTEAVFGDMTTINPILPTTSAGSDASRLVFNGLTAFNTQGELKGDLAERWDVSPDGKTYTFHLRQGVTWHDGVPFTSQDVLFTLTAIQNPDTRSPLAPTWKGVTAEAPDDQTVVFKLPKPYTPFVNATTVGILPRHSLERTEPRLLRISDFNQHPIGTGPYRVRQLYAERGELELQANGDYFKGQPYIQAIVLRSYESSDDALQAYRRRQVMGIAQLRPGQVSEAAETGTLKLHEAGVPDRVGVFFKTKSGITSDKAVRAALALATDRGEIVKNEFDGYASTASSPLIAPKMSSVGLAQPSRTNIEAAKASLEAAGWKVGADGVRTKNGQPLTLKLVTQSQTAYGAVAHRLQEQWRAAGVKLEVEEVSAETLQQSHIRPRNYDVLLYAINLGADPDVYAFWHSSQAADPGLNLSTYNSKTADAALEAGRIVRDGPTRAAKYRNFIQAWVQDTPAIMLYTPTYIYAVDREVRGIDIKRLVYPSDRFDQVERWSVRVQPVAAR